MRIVALTLVALFMMVQLLSAGGEKEQFEDLVAIARAQAGLEIFFSASRTYEEALSLSAKKEDKIDALYELAALYSDDLADTSEAIATYLRITEAYQNDERADVALYRIGLLLEETGRCYNAVDYYEKVIVNFPDSKYADYALEGSERCFQKNFDGAAAVVGDKPITVVELEEAINNLPTVYRSRYSTPEGKKEYLEKMIKDRMVELFSRENGFLDDPLVQSKINEAMMRILNEQFQISQVRKVVTVSEEEIKHYYEEHKDDYIKPEEVKIRHILTETEEEARQVLTELEAGRDFGELAAEYSIDIRSKDRGGDLGFVTPGRTVKAIEDAAFSLAPGEVSGPIKSRFGYHIVKVDEKRPKAYRPLEEVRELMASEVRRIKEEQRSKELTEELKHKYDVQVFTGHPDVGTGQE